MTASDITPTVVLTGPTGGIGRATATALVERAPRLRLVLLGRSPDALDAVADELRGPGRTVLTVPVDLADLRSVAAAGAAVRELVGNGQVGRIDALIANAGVQTSDRRHRTAQGLELTFGVNVVAQHRLIEELASVMAPLGHVVVLGSGTHRTDRPQSLVAHPRWEDPADLAMPDLGPDAGTAVAGQRAYATSKLAVNHLVHELARRYDGTLRVNVYDPGMIPGTGLARDLPGWKRFAWRYVMPRLPLPGTSTTARSGAVLADLALGRRFPGLHGGYVDIDEMVRPSDESFDEARERRLLQVCEQLGNARA